MNPFKSLLRLLKDTSVSKIELTATPPFVKLVFDREELLELLKGQALVANAISKHFVGRRVFWQAFPKQGPATSVIVSLEQAKSDLDDLCLKLSETKEISAVTLVKFLQGWESACASSLKSLKEPDEMDEEKSHDTLVLLRRTVYPLVSALVDFLADNDPTKQAAQQKLDEGWKVISDAQLRRESLPKWNAAA